MAREWRASPTIAALALGVLALSAGLVKSGIGVFPSWVYLYDLAANADDPARAPLMQPPADYLRANFPGPWLAGQLGITGRLPYLAFHLALTLAAILLPFCLPAIRSVPARARTVAALTAGSAVLVVLLGWVGGYDAVSVIAMSIAAITRHPVTIAAGWLLLGLNHPTLAVVAFALWLPVAFLVGAGLRWRATASASAGIVVGIAVNVLVVSGWGGATSRWQLLSEIASTDSVAALASSWPIVAFAAFGMGWVVLLAPGIRRSAAARILVVEGLVAATLLPLVLVDASRVVALALFPALLSWAAWSQEARAFGSRRRLWEVAFIAALIVPVPIVWNGQASVGEWSTIVNLDAAWQPPEGYSIPE